VKAKQYEQRADHEEWIGTVIDFESQVTDADFVQPREFWLNVLGKQQGQQENFVYNVSTNLSGAVKEVRYRAYATFRRIDENLGNWIEKETEAFVNYPPNNGEEIPGIFVGGDITSEAQISGSAMADAEQQAKVKDAEMGKTNPGGPIKPAKTNPGGPNMPVNGNGIPGTHQIAPISNGANGGVKPEKESFRERLDSVKDHVERGHLFNIVAKGFEKHN